MHKVVYIVLLLVMVQPVFSQVKKPRNLTHEDSKTLHWGFTVGLNSMDFAISRHPDAVTYADVIGFQPAGFQVSIVSDLRLTDNLNLRFLPGINLGSRNMIFFDPDTWEEDLNMTIGSSFLDFPLILKYRSQRVNNYRPYVIGGLSYRLDMSARGEYNTEQDDRILIKRGDFYLETGMGFESYLKYFKFSTEIKLAIGLRNMMTDIPYPGEEFYANSILGLRSYLVMLNFHFE